MAKGKPSHPLFRCGRCCLSWLCNRCLSATATQGGVCRELANVDTIGATQAQECHRGTTPTRIPGQPFNLEVPFPPQALLRNAMGRTSLALQGMARLTAEPQRKCSGKLLPAIALFLIGVGGHVLYVGGRRLIPLGSMIPSWIGVCLPLFLLSRGYLLDRSLLVAWSP